MKRRDWFKSMLFGAAGIGVKPPAFMRAATPVPPAAAASSAGSAEIYKQLGFATMTGEDPLAMWARLRDTQQWLAGPLSPDAWAGQVFIADHADIFAFRFLSIPAFWMADYQSGGRASFAAERFSKWFADWPKWWKSVGPKAPDNSYARLVWQMPDGGPEVTYEWAQTGPSEIVCRITNSTPSDVLLQGYVPWDSNPPAFSVLYSESAARYADGPGCPEPAMACAGWRPLVRLLKKARV
jgi:hypothetical protein